MRINAADRIDGNGRVRSDALEEIKGARLYTRLALGGEDVASDAEISSLSFDVLGLIDPMHRYAHLLKLAREIRVALEFIVAHLDRGKTLCCCEVNEGVHGDATALIGHE